MTALTLLLLLTLPATPTRPMDTLHVWEVFELELTAQSRYDHPYGSIEAEPGRNLVTVTFGGTSGAASGRQLTVAGFWDGGQTWRARFAPPAAGAWSYRSSSVDPGLNAVDGSFDVQDWTEDEKRVNPTRRGFLRVSENGRHFVHDDGTPFLWIGDTWWAWTKPGIHFDTYQKLVDDRAEKGFTLGQLFVPGNGWGRTHSALDSTFSDVDLEEIRKVDRMVRYANARGLVVWIHAWWSREGLDQQVGPEKMRRWWRYLVHRLGAYGVVWTLAGEYNMYEYGGLGLDFWKDLGRMVDEEDPYDRPIGAHPTPPGWDGGDGAPQWTTGEVIHSESWLDFNQSQVGHGRWRNELIPDIVASDYARTPARPTVVTEPWYEFVEGNPTARDVRFAAWSAILSGAAGHTYGGGHVWRGHVPEAPTSRGAWPLEDSFERTTLDYPGAVSMGHLAAFFRDVDWWRLSPHPELLSEYPDPYCLAAPGQDYVIYLRWGGSPKVDLRPSSADDRFVYAWFDPATGAFLREGTLPGGAIRFVPLLEDYPGREEFRDLVLWIRRLPFSPGPGR